MANVLVVVYSYTGNSRRLAQMLARRDGWTVAEVVERNPRQGIVGVWRCLMDSALRREPPISYLGPDPRGFAVTVLVSPIWAYRMAAPMRSFISEYRDRLRNVAVVSVMDRRGAHNAQAEFARLLRSPPVLSRAFLTRSVEDGSCGDGLNSFAQSLLAVEQSTMAAQSTARPAKAA